MAELLRHGLIGVEHRRNGSNLYTILPHSWMESSGEKIAPPLVKPIAPSSEARCTTAGEPDCTQRDKLKTLKEDRPRPVSRKRERWQIDNDIKSVGRQRARVFDRCEGAARRRGALTHDEIRELWRKAAKPNDVALYDSLTQRLHELEKELETA